LGLDAAFVDGCIAWWFTKALLGNREAFPLRSLELSSSLTAPLPLPISPKTNDDDT
jgi:hypothetical protein